MARSYGSGSDKGKAAAEVKKREYEELQKRHSIVERVVSVAVVLIGAAVLIFGILERKVYEEKTVQERAVLVERQKELEGINSAKDDESRIVEVEPVSSSAAEAGEAVCRAQNDLNAAIRTERASGAEYLTAQHQNALERLRMYIPSELSLESAARGTWCEYGTWEFNGVYNYEGDSTTVVWKCYEDSDKDKDRLLGFAMGDYSASSGVFSNVKVMLTSWYTTVSASAGTLVTPDQQGQDNGDNTEGADPLLEQEAESEEETMQSPEDAWQVTPDQGLYNNGDD